MQRRALWGVLVGALLLLFPYSSWASEGVVIAEILYDPEGGDAGYEWIKLKNDSGEDIDISGYRIEKAGIDFSLAFMFPDGARIIAGGEVVVGEALVTDADYFGELVFQNGGSASDGVRLVDSGGNVVDAMIYDGPDSNNLIVKSGLENIKLLPDVASGEVLRRGYSNLTPSPASPKGGGNQEVQLSEFLANPVGSDTEAEFIGLWNRGSDDVNLSGWRLDDASDAGSGEYEFGDVGLRAGEWRAWFRSETKITLNNTTDSVRLLNSSGEVVSDFSYTSVSEGVSWNNVNGQWQESETVTPGAKNVITKPKPQSTKAKIDEFLNEEDEGGEVAGEIVFTGFVTTEPGVLGTQVMYIENETDGLQIYFFKAEWPSVSVGDEVAVTGEMGSVGGEDRLKIVGVSDVVLTGKRGVITAKTVVTGEVGEMFEGQLVRVEGEVTETSGDVFFLSDDSGDVRVVIKETTGIDKPKMKRGDRVRVTGIVSETKTGYRILPREQEDVVLLNLMVHTPSPSSVGLGTSSQEGEENIGDSGEISFSYAGRAESSGDDRSARVAGVTDDESQSKGEKKAWWWLLLPFVLVPSWFMKEPLLGAK